MYYSKHHYRINPISELSNDYTWLFLPAGPGLGSEYLIPFAKQLKVPGTKLVVDFPGDGTNNNRELDFKLWHEGLIALLQTLHKPIIVTHDFSGMFALNSPQLEQYLSGMVLMNTSTQNSFFAHINRMREQYNLPDLAPTASAYHLNPTQALYKEFWQAYKHYYFTADELALGEQIMANFAFNNSSYYYGLTHFYPEYCCRWSPIIPTMTLSSEYDYICQPNLFIEHKDFQKPNIINHIIRDAGHCPWLLHLAQVQHCFDEFVTSLNVSCITLR